MPHPAALDQRTKPGDVKGGMAFLSLPSKFQIAQSVSVFNRPGTVQRVAFSMGKVLYDIALDEGGAHLQNVDSIFVQPFKP